MKDEQILEELGFNQFYDPDIPSGWTEKLFEKEINKENDVIRIFIAQYNMNDDDVKSLDLSKFWLEISTRTKRQRKFRQIYENSFETVDEIIRDKELLFYIGKDVHKLKLRNLK